MALKWTDMARCLAIFGFLACVACDSKNQDAETSMVSRSFLDKSAMFIGKAATEPFPTSAFMPEESVNPSNRFLGSLILESANSDIRMEILADLFGIEDQEQGQLSALPSISLELVQDGQDLIPLQRGRQDSGHPYWEWVVEPGKVWDEPGDGGWSRASLPFALLQRNANCTHNGVMTFLFRSEGSISPLVFQIASETCHYLRFNLWGVVPAYFEPANVPGREQIVNQHRVEQQARLPNKPLAQLAEDYPGALPGQFLMHDRDEISTYGFVIDGVHYSGGCPTRFGPYPYCEELDLPSYSLAKTLVGGTAMMLLEERYPGARHALVSDYVPECADERWEGVTLEHLLDMSTGNYLSTVNQEDEFQSYEGALFSEPNHAAKITDACSRFPRKSEPGGTWVYHTTDTYIAGALMNAFYREQTDSDQDFFDGLLDAEILRPMAFSPTARNTLRSYDDKAQPFTGYGLTLIPDDIARISVFLMNSGGKVEGEQVLDAKLLAAALQQDPADPGMTVEAGQLRYNNGLWAARLSSDDSCFNDLWIPFMSGYGGISVALLPNDTVYYVFSDGARFKWAGAALESHRLKPFCE